MYQRLLLLEAFCLLLIALVSVGVLAADKCSPSATAEGTFPVSLHSLNFSPLDSFSQIFWLLGPE